MKQHNDDYFISNYPQLDLHGETRDTMLYLLDSFITDNIKLGHKNIIIIHGKGAGILRKQTQEFLKKDKRVKTFYLGIRNPGCTVAELILDKE